MIRVFVAHENASVLIALRAFLADREGIGLLPDTDNPACIADAVRTGKPDVAIVGSRFGSVRWVEQAGPLVRECPQP